MPAVLGWSSSNTTTWELIFLDSSLDSRLSTPFSSSLLAPFYPSTWASLARPSSRGTWSVLLKGESLGSMMALTASNLPWTRTFGPKRSRGQLSFQHPWSPCCKFASELFLRLYSRWIPCPSKKDARHFSMSGGKSWQAGPYPLVGKCTPTRQQSSRKKPLPMSRLWQVG